MAYIILRFENANRYRNKNMNTIRNITVVVEISVMYEIYASRTDSAIGCRMVWAKSKLTSSTIGRFRVNEC